MKCPYNYNQSMKRHLLPVILEEVHAENIDEVSEIIHVTSCDYFETTERFMHDCTKDDCGAWQNGNCIRTA